MSPASWTQPGLISSVWIAPLPEREGRGEGGATGTLLRHPHSVSLPKGETLISGECRCNELCFVIPTKVGIQLIDESRRDTIDWIPPPRE